MGSEACVVDISSSDEDDDTVWLIKSPTLMRPPLSQKRQLVASSGDADVVVIDKQPCLEGRTRDRVNTLLGTFEVFQGKMLGSSLNGDDECCIVDHNLDKVLLSAQLKSNDEDELVVTGEKGPVACRDYPHARHLCVKLPFRTTPHENFCEQCHCYVCDELAPCSFWGEGKESYDHCHASDDGQTWKAMRQLRKSPSLQSTQSASHPLVSTTSRRSTVQPRSNCQPESSVGSFDLSLPASFNTSVSNLENLNSYVATVQRSSMRSSVPVHFGSRGAPRASEMRHLVSETRASGTNKDSIPAQNARVSSQNRMIDSSYASSPRSTTLQGSGFFSQRNSGTANQIGFTSVTNVEMMELNQEGQHSQNIISRSPMSDRRNLRGCNRSTSGHKGTPLQINLRSPGHAMHFQPSTNTNCMPTNSRPVSLSLGETSQCCPTDRVIASSELATLQHNVFGTNPDEREKDQPRLHDFFQLTGRANLSVNNSLSEKGSVVGEQVRVYQNVPEPLTAEVLIQDPMRLGAGLLAQEQIQELRGWDCSTISMASEHAITDANVHTELLQSHSVAEKNVANGAGLSGLPMGVETCHQWQGKTPLYYTPATQSVQLLASSDIPIISSLPLHDPQNNSELTAPQVTAGQASDKPPSWSDILAQLETANFWDGFDFEFFEKCL